MLSKASPLPLVKVAMPPRETLMPALESALYSGLIAEGEPVYAFERAFGDRFGVPNPLAMSSGTGALHVALILAGAGPGREVITTSMTAEPTNTVIMQTGATPVFADVDPDTGNMDVEAAAAAINSRTAAICVVHYAGYPADLDALRALADRHGIALVEDCAHALGARYRGAPIGTVGDSAIFSFQAIKHMTTVDGGLLTVKRADQAPAARRLRWFGLTKGVPRTEVDIVEPGFKYNMNNITATIGLAQLGSIDQLVDRHRDNGRYYDQKLASIPGLSSGRVLDGAQPTYWLYTLLSDDSDDIERRLADVGVTASKLHRPNHYHSAFRPFAREMPGLDTFYRRLVHIPCGWWVDDDARARIVDVLAKG